MKINQSILLGIIALLVFINILVITIFFVTQVSPPDRGGGNIPPYNQDPIPYPTPLPDTPTPPQPSCSLMPCHGTQNLNCTQESINCTMEFRSDDTCRQFAQCIQKGDSCTLAIDPQMEECQKCVQRCEDKYDAGIDVFSCTEKCTS